MPAHRGCVLLLFDSLDKAAHAALEIARLQPAACDLMDRRLLTIASRDRRRKFIRDVAIRAGDHDEIVVSGQHRVAAYDPATGREIWQADYDRATQLLTSVEARADLVLVSLGIA